MRPSLFYVNIYIYIYLYFGNEIEGGYEKKEDQPNEKATGANRVPASWAIARQTTSPPRISRIENMSPGLRSCRSISEDVVVDVSDIVLVCLWRGP